MGVLMLDLILCPNCDEIGLKGPTVGDDEPMCVDCLEARDIFNANYDKKTQNVTTQGVYYERI